MGGSSTAVPLFTARNNRSISQAPIFAAHPLGGRMVLFGTGKFYDNGDLTDISTEALYGIWDNGSPVSYSSLLQRTATAEPVTDRHGKTKTYYKVDSGVINWATHKGWTLPLNMEEGQRSLFTPKLLGNNVEFATSLTKMDTSLTESCSVEGLKGINVIVNLFSGGRPSIQVDTNGDGIIDARDGYYIGYPTDTNGPGLSMTYPGMPSRDPSGSGVDCGDGIYLAEGGQEYCVESRNVSSFNQLF